MSSLAMIFLHNPLSVGSMFAHTCIGDRWKTDPIAAVEILAASYHQECPMTSQEASILYPLMCTRLTQVWSLALALALALACTHFSLFSLFSLLSSLSFLLPLLSSLRSNAYSLFSSVFLSSHFRLPCVRVCSCLPTRAPWSQTTSE